MYTGSALQESECVGLDSDMWECGLCGSACGDEFLHDQTCSERILFEAIKTLELEDGLLWKQDAYVLV